MDVCNSVMSEIKIPEDLCNSWMVNVYKEKKMHWNVDLTGDQAD